MKLALYLSLILFSLLSLENESLSLTDYKIKKICKNHRYKSACIKNFQDKRSNLHKGNYIEIPVIPYKK